MWCIGTQLFDGKWSENYVPVENFKELEDLTQDDTHDLRTRWFATQEEAGNWAQHVEETWNNPEPWRIFVCLQ